jgi:hypothetical protein
METRQRINAFDWNREFPDAMRAGGFDAVIGNPPYIRIQAMKEWAPVEVEFYKKRYVAASKGNYDIYVVFVEKGLELLNQNGLLGYILPHKFFNAKYGEPLRGLIAAGQHLRHVVHFGDQQVFDGATTYTCLMVLSKSEVNSYEYVDVKDIAEWRKSASVVGSLHQMNTLTEAPWNISTDMVAGIFQRLQSIHDTLGSVANIFQGLVTGADGVYVSSEVTNAEPVLMKRFLSPDRLRPYSTPIMQQWMLFPYLISEKKAVLITPDELRKNYPVAWSYLNQAKSKLVARERGKWDRIDWYAFARSQNLAKMEGEKLIIQVTAKDPTVLYDDLGIYMTGGGSGPFYGIRPTNSNVDIFSLLGILNSSLFGFVVRQQSTPLRGGYIKFSKQYIESFPIPIHHIGSAGHSLLQNIGMLAQRMIEMNRSLTSAKTSQDKTFLEREIAQTDARIDRLVYELYGLTESEIAVVEGRA